MVEINAILKDVCRDSGLIISWFDLFPAPAETRWTLEDDCRLPQAHSIVAPVITTVTDPVCFREQFSKIPDT